MSTQPAAPQPSGSPPPPRKMFGLSRPVLIGIGVGCGCLSVIIGILVVIVIIAAVQGPSSERIQPAPVARPTPPAPSAAATPQAPSGSGQPQPQPGPGEPGPGLPPGAEGPEDVKMTAQMVKVQGQAPNAQPGEPADTFTAGEDAGAVGQIVLVAGEQKVVRLWARIENGKPVLLGEPRLFTFTRQDQGKQFFFTTKVQTAGDYGFGLGKLVGEQVQPILVRRFRVQ